MTPGYTVLTIVGIVVVLFCFNIYVKKMVEKAIGKEREEQTEREKIKQELLENRTFNQMTADFDRLKASFESLEGRSSQKAVEYEVDMEDIRKKMEKQLAELKEKADFHRSEAENGARVATNVSAFLKGTLK